MHIRIKKEQKAKGIIKENPPFECPIQRSVQQQPSLLQPSRSHRKCGFETIPPEKIGSLIIGIDEYPIPAWHLYKCITDAVNFRKFLHSIYNIPAGNIKALYNLEASKFNILRSLDNLSKNYDYGIIFFSCHGYRVRANDGPGDYYAEGIVHSKHAWTRSGMLLDVDIKQRINGMAQCVVVGDACHFEGFARSLKNGQQKIKAISPPKEGVRFGSKFFKNLVNSKDINRENIWELAACKSNEQAYELNDGGAYTTTLIKILTEDPCLKMPNLQTELRQKITTNQTPVITAPNLPLFSFLGTKK